MKKQILTAVLAIGSLCSFAQNGGKIFGSIKDGGQQAVIDASSVSLLLEKDSSLVKTSITDKEGKFLFENLADGNYLVAATSVGYQKTFSKPMLISETQKEEDAGVLQLLRIPKDLAAVVVTSKRQLIERKIDRTIVNVDGYISNTGSTAMEVLEKAPGVSVDKDGNISLKGKQGVIIMIDGKPTYMSGQDLANYLTSMPSSNLDQLEIMTNPSAKYDASGNSGIINIKTKKLKQRGFNGSLSSSYGQAAYPKISNSLNLNYRNGKFNSFASINGNYRKGTQTLDIYRELLDNSKNIDRIFTQRSEEKRMRQYYGIKAGMDYNATAKTTLGFVLTGYYNPTEDPGNNTSYFKDEHLHVDSMLIVNRSEKGKWKNGGINVNMRHKFDSTGRELTADLDYLKYNATDNMQLLSNTYSPMGDLLSHSLLIGNLPQTLDIFSAKTDYTQTLAKTIKLEAGLKTSFVKTNNKAQYYNRLNGRDEVDYNRTNFFDYKENLNAAYINLSTEVKKWGFQAGLRVENTNYDALQYGNITQPDSAFKNSYTSLFPTVYLSYKMNDKNQWGFSYGRRINRPNYEDLNPFIHYLDQYTYDVGNPFLKPMYADKFEISHTYNNFLTTSLNYTVTKNLFNESFSRDDQAIVVRKSNFGKLQSANLSVSAQIPVLKWWKAQLYTEGNYYHLHSKIEERMVNIETTTFLANLVNQFSFKKGWSGELSAFGRTKAPETQIIINRLGVINVAVQKQVLKNKGSFKLAVTDITGPMKVTGNIADLGNAHASFVQHRDSRVITVSFNYRFGKPMKTERRRTGAATDEQNRVGGAN